MRTHAISLPNTGDRQSLAHDIYSPMHWRWGGGLSFMSCVGHVIYGFVAAFAFERCEAKTMTR
jgi:hypothetical protein